MKVLQTSIQDLLVLEPSLFKDERGYFQETFNQNTFREATGLEIEFVQDNESMSNEGVLRGMHFQIPPFAQDKLVRVIRGSVIDVAVDMRTNSSTFGKYESVLLSAENKKQFFVPKGFAHGFLVLEDHTIFSYKCSNFYARDHERSLSWNDPEIGINWSYENPILSEKDKKVNTKLEDFKGVF